MEAFVEMIIQRFRPRVGWPQTLLALVVAVCPALATTDSTLQLPIGIFFWAGVIGLAAGMRGGRRAGEQPTDTPAPRSLGRNVRVALWLLVVGVGFGAILLMAVGEALPSAGLIVQDAAARIGWLIARVRHDPSAGAPPLSRAWIFVSDALPRAWSALVAAPGAGERGARLMLAAGGVASTWAGSLALGWGLSRRRRLLGWGLPLLAALTLTTVFGGGSGVLLVVGLGALLLLGIMTDFRRREAGWERSGTDFSDELSRDVLMWGGLIVAVMLALAWLLPTWLDNPFADAVWHDVEPPSGLAVLERNIRRPQSPRTVDPGISKLPALRLGLSLEQAPPDTLALRVQLDTPLPSTPWPHYWRARVFNIYNGREWTTNARVGAIAPSALNANAFPDAILQTITDERKDRQIMVGLADVIAVDGPASAERLPDGTLAALTGEQPGGQYRVLSRAQEFAPLPEIGSRPPDMRGYLGLPGGLPPRVRELADAIAGERTSAFDQALALERYLRELPYAYQVQPLPRGGDAVDQFLFDMRQGYCTYYASSMAVLARSLGIPARVAIGYATGSYDPASGAYIVREADAHAWPELYVNDRWLPFEPTPIRPLPARAGAQAPQAPAGAPVAQEQGRGGLALWAAALAAIMLLVAGGVWLARRLRPVPLIAQTQIELERRGRLAGIPWPDGATLHEYGALLEPRLGGAAGALRELIDLIERSRYGGRALHDDEQRRLRAAGRQVWAQLGRRGRQP